MVRASLETSDPGEPGSEKTLPSRPRQAWQRSNLGAHAISIGTSPGTLTTETRTKRNTLSALSNVDITLFTDSEHRVGVPTWRR
jgi:hypothetical protein